MLFLHLFHRFYFLRDLLPTQGNNSPTPEDLRYGASVIELYRCKVCNYETRFPRYNDPEKLLETRTGMFVLFCFIFFYSLVLFFALFFILFCFIFNSFLLSFDFLCRSLWRICKLFYFVIQFCFVLVSLVCLFYFYVLYLHCLFCF
jgi:hypothetical protein